MKEMSDKMVEKLRDLLLEGEFIIERLRNILRVKRLDDNIPSKTIKIIKAHEDVVLPIYSTKGAAGMDIFAYIGDSITLPANQKTPKFISTGIRVAIPEGYQLSIRPRSGLGKKGIIIPNSPGLIDSDYRGEILIMLLNTSDKDYTINPNDRIAQLLLEPVTRIGWLEVNELSDTDRGEGGFSSTGK